MLFDCPFPAGWTGLGYALLLAGAYLLGVWQGAGAGARGRVAAAGAPPRPVGRSPAARARAGDEASQPDAGPAPRPVHHAGALADNRPSS